MPDGDVDVRSIEAQLGDRYQIIRTLGRGAFGAVYLARERQLHRLVAIKVLAADRAWSDDERARLLAEARTIANLSHPAIVPLLAFGEAADTVYMVMPYVGGETLADRLRETGALDPIEARRILIEIADALAYAHGEGVLHRDLKPENVILERAGAVDDHVPPRVRLIDFGVAAFPGRDRGMNPVQGTWGTPHFMAPELLFGEPALDPRSEMYALGVLGFLLLGGRLPFDATSPTERITQQRKGPVVPLSMCAPDAPKDLVSAIERCLAYESEHRWRRAREFRDVLVRGAELAAGSRTPLSLVRQHLRPAAIERIRPRGPGAPAVPLAARIRHSFATLPGDIRFGVRSLRKSPGFSAAVVLTLAIGLAATTVVLSTLEAVVLRPLPVADPSALVMVNEKRAGPNQTSNFFSSAYRYDRYLAYREATRSVFTGLAAQNFEDFSVRAADRTMAVMGLTTSDNYFEVVGVQPAAGRFYTTADGESKSPVAVLGYEFWQRAYRGDPGVVGRTLFVDSRPLTIVGVAPRGFNGGSGAVFGFDVWVPIPGYDTTHPTDGTNEQSQGSHWMTMFGRLRPGVTPTGASEALRVIAPRVPTENPATKILNAWAEPVHAMPLELRGVAERFVFVLMGVAFAVLFIAAANAAGMLLARGATRRRELATRLAIGASRTRVVRQLLVESVTLCVVGGAFGLLIALALTRFLNTFQPFPIRTAVDFSVDGKVLLGVAAVVLGTGLLAGLAPAIHATGIDLSAAMKQGGLRSSPRAARLRSAFVIGQVALSVVLLMSAGLFLRSLQASLAVDFGFDATNVVNGGVSPGLHGYDAERSRQLYATLLDRVRARPEIAGAAYANAAPFSGNVNNWDAKRIGHPDDQFSANWSVVDVGFIELLRTRLLAGRTITAADRKGAENVTVINETLAHELWPDIAPSTAVGRELVSLGRRMRVVGVIANGKYASPHERPRGFGYVPFAQQFSASARLYVRARVSGALAIGAVQQELAKLNPNIAFERPTLLTDDINKNLLQERVGARLVAAFGAVGVLLAIIGLYGVLAFGVAQRLREFGIRVALGAKGMDIMSLVTRYSLGLVGTGVALGLVAGVASGRFLAGFLFDVHAADPAIMLMVALILIVVGLVATLVPARRAAMADPITALRAE